MRSLLSSIAGQLRKVANDVERIKRAKRGRHGGERSAADAVYVTVCPYGTRPCDERQMVNGMFACPIDRAPNPILIDKAGNVCYATADLEQQISPSSPKNANVLFQQKAQNIITRFQHLMLTNPELGKQILSLLPALLSPTN